MYATKKELRNGAGDTAKGDREADPLQLLTPKEAAELLRVKPNTLAHARSGRGSLKFPVVWIGPKTPRYRRSDIVAFIEHNTFSNTAQSHSGWANRR